MAVGLQFKPKILGFLCNWCAYAGADLCGVSRYQYPPNLRVVRVMCSGRVDMELIFRAFQDGMDGVFIGGCWPGECHYITEGNYDALSTMHLTRRLLARIGLAPERLRLAWVSASEGIRFAEVMNEFTARVKELGPLGRGEGLGEEQLRLRLEAAVRLIPYLKLVERQRFRVPVKSEEAYNEFFEGGEADRLFDELVRGKLVQSQIMLLLHRHPLSTAEISQALGLSAAEVLEHAGELVRKGLVRYDLGQRRFAVA